MPKSWKFIPLLFIFTQLLLSPSTTFADNPPPAGVDQFAALIVRIINISVGLAFVALLVVVVSAGIKYITSQGEQKNTSNARDTLVWGFLGIFFLAAGWAVLQLIQNFTGLNLTKFCFSFNGC